jgi:hypothetical protein
METDRASDGPVGDRVSSADAVAIAKSLVHRNGLVPSLTALDPLLLREWERRLGTLTEADEQQAMRASKLVDHLGSEVLVLRRVKGLVGGPTVLVSKRAFPDADSAFVLDHLRHLKSLGSTRVRRDALEIHVSAALTRLSVPYGFRVDLRSEGYDSICNDIAVFRRTVSGSPELSETVFGPVAFGGQLWSSRSSETR